MSDEKQSASEKKKEDWMNSKWRPMMGWMYMVVCFMDMVIFPIAWSLAQTLLKQPITQWNPLTLQGAGLFHIAMGAVLGIAAYGRTQEKLGGANNGGIQLPAGSSSTSPPPATGFQPSMATPAPVANSWGSQPLGNSAAVTAPSPSWGAAPAADVTQGWGGKKAPPPITDFPEK